MGYPLAKGIACNTEMSSSHHGVSGSEPEDVLGLFLAWLPASWMSVQVRDWVGLDQVAVPEQLV